MHLFEHTSGDGLLARAQLEVGQVVGALGDRQRTHVRDRLLTETLVVEGDGEDLGAQAGTTALGARDVTHVSLVPVLHLLGLGLFHAPVQERHHTFELGVVRARAAVAVAETDVHLVVAAVQDRLTRLEREFLPRRLGVEPHLVAEAREQPEEIVRVVAARPRRDRTVGKRQVRVGHDEFLVHLFADAEPVALRACTVRRVERKGPRFEVVDGDRVAVGAGHPLGEAPFAVGVVLLQVDEVEHHHTVGQAQCGLDRVGESLFGRGLDGQPVHHDLDVVLLLLLELWRIGERVHHAIDPGTRKALCLKGSEQVDEFTLAGADHRRQHLETDALFHLEHLVDDLLRGLLLDGRTALGAMGLARTCVEQTEVVVDLGDGADGGTRVPVGGLLVDRDRG